jgi:hypothetical protein
LTVRDGAGDRSVSGRNYMSVNTNGALVIALIVAVGLFIVVGGGGSMTGRMGGGMMTGPAWMHGVGGLWIPAVLTAALGGWLVWRVVRK